MTGLKVECVDWSDEAQEALSIESFNCSVLDIRRQVIDDRAALFKITRNDETLGFYVLRVDKLEAGYEGVIFALACKNSEFDMVETLEPIMRSQFINCQSIRLHTARGGLVKKLTKLGYMPQEFVMKKFL